MILVIPDVDSSSGGLHMNIQVFLDINHDEILLKTPNGAHRYARLTEKSITYSIQELQQGRTSMFHISPTANSYIATITSYEDLLSQHPELFI